MSVQLHGKLSRIPKWRTILNHANELLVEYDLSDYEIFIRTSQISIQKGHWQILTRKASFLN